MAAKNVKARREDRDYEDLVRLYLEDVGRHDLLTKDDEIRLAQEIEGGIEARIARAITSVGELYRLERRQPTLENVFLSYIGHDGAAVTSSTEIHQEAA